VKAPRKKVILAIFLWIFAFLIIGVRSPLWPWWKLKNFERQVKRNIDPMELQQWVTNLSAQHSGETWLNYYGTNFFDSTNFPTGFKKVRNYRNGMRILMGGSEPSIAIFGGFKGGPFLVLESPLLAARTNQTVIPWKPGIYFVGEKLDWR